MSADQVLSVWRRVRVWVLATCTVWLVLQNLALVVLLLVGHPEDALAAGRVVARTAMSFGASLLVIPVAVALGLALAAWLVHGVPVQPELNEEVRHER